jgi:hypothetical protein
MMVWECMSTYYVPFVGGSGWLVSYGLVHGTCNHVDCTKHMAAMGRLS